MPVYVDDMYLHQMGKFGRMKMSHMIADTDEELHEMARHIGVAKRWFQKPETPGRHYDICMSMRNKALGRGAISITLRQAATMCYRRSVTGALGTPETADAWRTEHRGTNA